MAGNFEPVNRSVASPPGDDSSPLHAPSRAPEAQLVRAIGPLALSLNAVNLTVGAGIFALPAVVAAMLGPAALLAYLVCGLLVICVLACFAEIGSRVTRSGGAVAYIEEAFGPFAGFLAFATFTIAFSVVSNAAIANVLADSLAHFAPALRAGAPRVLLMLLLFGGLATVNVRGVRQGTRLAVGITVAKLLPLILLIVLGLFAMQWRELRIVEWPTLSQLGAASLVLFFAFAGIESALSPSGEIREPERTVPRGILGAAGALILFYAALQGTAQGVLGGDLASHTEAPLAAVGERLLGPWGGTLIVAGAALSVFGTLSADMIGAPRAFLVAAERGLLPAALMRVHPRFRTPWVAIVTFATSAFVLAVSGGFRALAVMGSIALLLVYLAVCLAVLWLRRTRPQQPGAFRAPFGPAIPILGAVTVGWLLSNSTRAEAVAMAALLAVAAAYYALRARAVRD